jgi:methionyl aminopeptidase
MALAIEPMENLGSDDTRVLRDDWTVVTADGKSSVHFEHTIIVTDGDPIVTTKV